jgi:hemerythrin-like domain-containing protein
MSNEQMLRKQHQGLHQMANELEKSLAAPDPRARLQTAILWLSRMTGLLALHLALEDKVLYPQLIGRGEGEAESRLRGFVAEVGGLKADFEAYRRRWARPAAMESDWEAFARETRVFLDGLRSRIRLEDKEVYVLMEKAGA